MKRSRCVWKRFDAIHLGELFFNSYILLCRLFPVDVPAPGSIGLHPLLEPIIWILHGTEKLPTKRTLKNKRTSHCQPFRCGGSSNRDTHRGPLWVHGHRELKVSHINHQLRLPGGSESCVLMSPLSQRAEMSATCCYWQASEHGHIEVPSVYSTNFPYLLMYNVYPPWRLNCSGGGRKSAVDVKHKKVY